MSDSGSTSVSVSVPNTGLVRKQARALSLEAGFTEAGLVALPHAEESRDAGRFAHWIEAGRAGTMQYLERAAENGQLVRERVGLPFPWARSAIVCFSSYHAAQPRSIDMSSIDMSSIATEPHGIDAPTAGQNAHGQNTRGWIARYAWSSRRDGSGLRRPSDYHKVLLKRLKALDARLRSRFGEFESRAYVDTGPVVERSLAVAAGLGWTGKNTCLIHPKLGSFGFLSVLLTSLPVEEENAPVTPTLVPDRCGTCRRCIEACPTDALVAPYQMDATRCIAYLTIEHKGIIPEEFAAGIGRQVFGCDICQDVCPWNRKAPVGTDPELEARPELVNPALDWLGGLDEKSFEQTFNGSPVRRTGFWGLRRNVAIAMGNSGQEQFVPRLRKWADATDEGLRAAARWALARLHATE